MDIEQLRNFCISQKGVSEHFPFDETTLVFKVMGKMFLLTSLKGWEEGSPAINVKCDPEHAITLRESYESITAGYHMSKKHWNTIALNTGEISRDFLYELILDSYDLVVAGLTKKLKAELQNL